MRHPESQSTPEGAFLRQLVQEKREEIAKEEQKNAEEGDALDQLWRKKRAEYEPKLLVAGKAEIVRRARDAARNGQTKMTIDLGVDERRLRLSSPTAPLNLADAVLSEKGIEDPKWGYLNRVGWLIQVKDGKQISEFGKSFVLTIQQLGIQVRFTPYFVQDSHAEPYRNATLELSW